MRLASLYTHHARLIYKLPRETNKWEIPEVRRSIFDPLQSVAFCWEQARFMAYTNHRATTAPVMATLKMFVPQIPIWIMKDGELIAQYGEKRRIQLRWIKSAGMVQSLYQDGRQPFYEHHGVDRWGSSCGKPVALISSRASQGVSTITQHGKLLPQSRKHTDAQD